MRINNNLMAMNAKRFLNVNNTNTQKSIEKLSSGNRINKAGDDAAGLSISEKMRAQIRGLDMAAKNSQDAISLIQTAEGALNETHSILQRMREVAVQAANDTNYEVDRTALEDEIKQLNAELKRIADETEFNEQKLINGDISTKIEGDLENATLIESVVITDAGELKDGVSISVTQQVLSKTINEGEADEKEVFDGIKVTVNGEETIFTVEDISGGMLPKEVTDSNNAKFIISLDATARDLIDTETGGNPEETDTLSLYHKPFSFQIGANKNQKITLAIGDMSAEGLGVDKIDLKNNANANSAIEAIDDAIELVSKERSKLGAYQNRLEHTINNLNTSSENLTAAESRIRDVDMADEMMEYTKSNILAQAATAMLAQANQAPQSVLQLLQ